MSEDIVPISPDLQASLVCEDVRQEANGKFILIGLFDRLNIGGGFPAAAPRICVFNRWCCGCGEFEQRTRIVAPDGTTRVAEGGAIAVKLASDTATATAVEVFVNPRLPAPGVYWIEIDLDRQLKVRYPLTVAEGRPPPATARGGR